MINSNLTFDPMGIVYFIVISICSVLAYFSSIILLINSLEYKDYIKKVYNHPIRQHIEGWPDKITMKYMAGCFGAICFFMFLISLSYNPNSDCCKICGAILSIGCIISLILVIFTSLICKKIHLRFESPQIFYVLIFTTIQLIFGHFSSGIIWFFLKSISGLFLK